MANNRIYYAVQQVGIKPDADTGAFTTNDEIHGIQSVGMTTNFNLQSVFELGQLALYENVEDLPDVEVSLTKVLDGYPLIYHLATIAATSPTLAGRSNVKCIFGLAIFDDTTEAAEGTPGSIVQCSGMYTSSLSYSFPLEDNFTEEATLVGNDKVWLNTPNYGDTLNSSLPTPAFEGQFSSTSDDSPPGLDGVNRRENLKFAYTASALDINGMVAEKDATILPPEIFGITNSGTNEKISDVYGAHVSNIGVSVDLGREKIHELGRFGPYHRYLTFPIEVSCEVEVTSSSGDMISATEDGIWTTGTDPCLTEGNLKDRTIRVATCEGTIVYLGAKNKLASVNYGGGDTGGGNVSVTYTFTNFNDFTVLHSGDPNASGSTWWTNRATYVIDPT